MKKQTGFTLIELIVAVAVFAIVAAMAAPNLKSYTANNRSTTQLNALVSAMNLARSEAVKLGESVIVCASDTSATPPYTCNGTANVDWKIGWIVFMDNPTSGTVGDYDANDTLLRVFERLNPSATVANHTISMVEIDTGLAKVTYSSNGFSSNTASFRRCDERGTAKAKSVLMSNTGRVRVDTKDSSGTALTCP